MANFRASVSSINQTARAISRVPGDNPSSLLPAQSINAKILVELRIQTMILQQLVNSLTTNNQIQDYDIDMIRADPSSLGQRLG